MLPFLFQLYNWRNGEFQEIPPELGLPDIVRAVVWAGDSLCVGFKREYSIIKVISFIAETNCSSRIQQRIFSLGL